MLLPILHSNLHAATMAATTLYILVLLPLPHSELLLVAATACMLPLPHSKLLALLPLR